MTTVATATTIDSCTWSDLVGREKGVGSRGEELGASACPSIGLEKTHKDKQNRMAQLHEFPAVLL